MGFYRTEALKGHKVTRLVDEKGRAVWEKVSLSKVRGKGRAGTVTLQTRDLTDEEIVDTIFVRLLAVTGPLEC